MFTDIAWTIDAVIFAVIACASVLFLFLSLLMGGIFDLLDHGGDSIFSVQSITGFMAGFGAIAWVLTGYAGQSPIVSAFGGLLAGVPMGASAYLMARLFKKAAADSGFDMASIVGQIGVVTMPISPSGIGRVSVSKGGGTYTVWARCEGGNYFSVGQSVKIVSESGGQCTVASV